jgi:hypothetical protein
MPIPVHDGCIGVWKATFGGTWTEPSRQLDGNSTDRRAGRLGQPGVHVAPIEVPIHHYTCGDR